MNKPLQNQKGIAILTVMLTFLSMFILLSAIVFMSVKNSEVTITETNYSKAYYVAESTLNKRMAEVNSLFYTLAASKLNSADLFTKLETDVNILPKTLTFESTQDNDSAELSFVATDSNVSYPNHFFFKVIVIGTVNGISRTLSKEIGFNYRAGGQDYIIGKAVLTQRSIIIGDQSSQVIGPVASNLLDNTTIEINKKQDSDKTSAFVPTGKQSSVINPINIGNRVYQVSEPFVFPIINYPLIPTTSPTLISPYTFINNKATINVNTVTGYSTLENMTIAQGQTLIINLGSKGTSSTRKMLKVKNIDVSGNIRVIGTGRLLLVFEYGRGNLIMGPKFNVCGDVVGSCTQANPDYTKFLFYLKTPLVTKDDDANYKTLVFENQQLFYGSLLAEYVNISVLSGNFKGHIVTSGKTVSFTSNSTIMQALFYAPFAKITISSNANLSGSLVGNEFVISQPQTLVTYMEVNKESFPFTIDFPRTGEMGEVSAVTEIIEGPLLEN